ncbi:putative ct20 family protein [Scedosporium apiospermum]|uniref:Putative ct20 family protein n=1 Tax=Pseudallescheria apiosperma TaxID=563466 RepID=A0A084G180_PSEDA|nr:putative ct20 family protein [Scedosporium apiospermum]KEZ41092.1 putative ct20 family protein [Scedosporium apiospermum]
MPPRKKARGGASQSVSTPNTTKSDDAMDIDTPKSETPSKATAAGKGTTTVDIHNDMWTDDQLSSLFKGVIRWKPAGMHKHFRMIAISEHLRNHGFDPDIHQHTRIPRIWERLRAHYNLDIINDRENFDDDAAEDKYLEFSLGRQFHELIEERVLRGSSSEMSSEESVEEEEEEEEEGTEEPESEKEKEKEPPAKPGRRSKRGSERLRSGRSSTIDDSEDVTETESPAPKAARTARGRGRGRGRGGRGGRVSVSKQASEVEESSEEEEEEESGSEEEEESAEEATPARSTRGARGGRGRGGSRGRGRGRGRGRS